jgi:hypothetical protein
VWCAAVRWLGDAAGGVGGLLGQVDVHLTCLLYCTYLCLPHVRCLALPCAALPSWTAARRSQRCLPACLPGDGG